MNATIPYVPETPEEARQAVDGAPVGGLNALTQEEFVCVWNSLAYLCPELHPDNADEWPEEYRSFALEAWRRFENGELTDEELYPSDAQWCGLYDQMALPTVEESTRRIQFIDRPMIRVGDIVRFRRSSPSEVDALMVVTEWNIDRGYGKSLNTGVAVPSVQMLRFSEVEAVGRIDG